MKTKEKKYYRLYDKQTGRYMATGYNADSKKDLTKQYLSFISSDWEDEEEELFKKLSEDEMIEVIESNEFVVETNNAPFDENDIG